MGLRAPMLRRPEKEEKNMMYGNCGEQLTYQLHKDVLDIRGSGIARRDPDGKKWQELERSVRHVNIWPGCTELEEGLFAGWRLSSVDFPETLRRIGRGCFAGSRVGRIHLPAGITLEADSFAECIFLRSAEFMGKTLFGEDCFRGCGALSDLFFGEEPEQTGWRKIFGGCPGLVWRDADAVPDFSGDNFEAVDTDWEEDIRAVNRFYVPKQHYYQLGCGPVEFTDQELFCSIGRESSLKLLGRFSEKGSWYRWL